MIGYHFDYIIWFRINSPIWDSFSDSEPVAARNDSSDTFFKGSIQSPILQHEK